MSTCEPSFSIQSSFRAYLLLFFSFLDRDTLMRHFGHGVGHQTFGRLQEMESEIAVVEGKNDTLDDEEEAGMNVDVDVDEVENEGNNSEEDEGTESDSGDNSDDDDGGYASF